MQDDATSIIAYSTIFQYNYLYKLKLAEATCLTGLRKNILAENNEHGLQIYYKPNTA